MVDVTSDARRHGYPVLENPDVTLDPAAAAIVPPDADVVGVSLVDGILEVVTDHVPTAAEVAALERATGCEVCVTVASGLTYRALAGRVDGTVGAPAVLDALASRAATSTRVTLRTGQVPTVGDDLTISAVTEVAALRGADVEAAARWFLGRRDQGVVPWAGHRWRVQVTTAAGAPALTLRRTTTPTAVRLDELGLPAAVADLTDLPEGLVLVASPAGHGRTTTLHAIADRICAQRAAWVVSVSDSAESTSPARRSHVTTQLVGTDVASVADAASEAVRDGSNVLIVDVARLDGADVEALVRAALGGLVVLVAVPAASVLCALAAFTVAVPDQQRTSLFASLAQAFRAGVAQRLAPATAGGKVPAVELWWASAPVSTALSRGDLAEVRAASFVTGTQGRRNIDMAGALDALAAGGLAAPQ